MLVDTITSDATKQHRVPQLVVVFPPGLLGEQQAEERFDLTENEVFIGSSNYVKIQLPKQVVQLQHAYIYCEDGTWYFQDLTETLQVTIDGLIVTHFPLTADGESFSIGPLFCKFVLGNTENARYEQHLYEQARMDPMTQVANQGTFLRKIRQELSRIAQTQEPLSLLMLDVDHFRDFNTLHGHAAGDAVLREIAHRMMQQLRKTELLARIGGEEFAILLPAAGNKEAFDIAERIRLTICQTPVAFEDKLLSVTASIGLATTQQPVDAELFMKQADQLLYLAKGRGRNRVEGITEP